MIGRPPNLARLTLLRRAGWSLGVAAILFTASGCGQTGPLALPERAPVTSGDGSDGGGPDPATDDANPDDAQSTPDER